jgi:hypothetical protein
MYWHKKSIILIDEPDAHLEILRQRQIFAILKKTAEENGSQVIMATHSEAILDDAVDTNLTLLFLNGTADNVADRKDMRNALRTYGIEHYYKAKIHPRILYIEGSTDVAILRELAALLNHEKAVKVMEKLNLYYTQNIEPEDDLENEIARAGGANKHHLSHFNAIKAFVPELKGFALFDGDNKNRSDVSGNGIITMYWKKYEIENYFLNPELLIQFIEERYNKQEHDLFMHEDVATFIQALNETLVLQVFDNSTEVLDQYNNGTKEVKRFMLQNTKMSEFAEEVFRCYAEKMGQPRLLAKGEFYRLVPLCNAEEIPKEVTEKLDRLVEYLEYHDA